MIVTHRCQLVGPAHSTSQLHPVKLVVLRTVELSGWRSGQTSQHRKRREKAEQKMKSSFESREIVQSRH